MNLLALLSTWLHYTTKTSHTRHGQRQQHDRQRRTQRQH